MSCSELSVTCTLTSLPTCPSFHLGNGASCKICCAGTGGRTDFYKHHNHYHVIMSSDTVLRGTTLMHVAFNTHFAVYIHNLTNKKYYGNTNLWYTEAQVSVVIHHISFVFYGADCLQIITSPDANLRRIEEIARLTGGYPSVVGVQRQATKVQIQDVKMSHSRAV